MGTRPDISVPKGTETETVQFGNMSLASQTRKRNPGSTNLAARVGRVAVALKLSPLRDCPAHRLGKSQTQPLSLHLALALPLAQQPREGLVLPQKLLLLCLEVLQLLPLALARRLGSSAVLDQSANAALLLNVRQFLREVRRALGTLWLRSVGARQRHCRCGAWPLRCAVLRRTVHHKQSPMCQH